VFRLLRPPLLFLFEKGHRDPSHCEHDSACNRDPFLPLTRRYTGQRIAATESHTEQRKPCRVICGEQNRTDCAYRQ
jgi:hypothetical protein